VLRSSQGLDRAGDPLPTAAAGREARHPAGGSGRVTLERGLQPGLPARGAVEALDAADLEQLSGRIRLEHEGRRQAQHAERRTRRGPLGAIVIQAQQLDLRSRRGEVRLLQDLRAELVAGLTPLRTKEHHERPLAGDGLRTRPRQPVRRVRLSDSPRQRGPNAIANTHARSLAHTPFDTGR